MPQHCRHSQRDILYVSSLTLTSVSLKWLQAAIKRNMVKGTMWKRFSFTEKKMDVGGGYEVAQVINMYAFLGHS